MAETDADSPADSNVVTNMVAMVRMHESGMRKRRMPLPHPSHGDTDGQLSQVLLSYWSEKKARFPLRNNYTVTLADAFHMQLYHVVKILRLFSFEDESYIKRWTFSVDAISVFVTLV